ncbi:hypothetical protein [Nonlabens xiamenensis]|uniref:hypothetical protein n=1 Tax=Nonlabens xiamenensis TaxID=2341043 RepID=UPI000F607FCA|nr:hypothetical protein [Nonlabens xiamenensis]
MNPVLIAKAGKFVYENRKPIAYTIGGAVLLYVGYRVVSGLLEDDRSESEDPSLPASTLSDVRTRAISEQLHKLMIGFTKSQDVFDVVVKLSHNDFIKVGEMFGERSYSPAGFGTDENVWFLPNKGLRDWVQNELNDRHLEIIRKRLPGIFGI